MLTLIIRTDKPEAEIGLYSGVEKVAYKKWMAHRALAETIHQKIKALLESTHNNLHALEGIIVFKGPGSFTGLRIGMSVANALAYSLSIPIVSAEGKDWIEVGLNDINAGKNEVTAMPEYGAVPHITQQRK